MHPLILRVKERIKEEMEIAGYDQKSFAAKFNKTEAWMVAKLKHGRKLTLEDIVFFSEALDIPYALFFPDEIAREVVRRISFKELIELIGKD